MQEEAGEVRVTITGPEGATIRYGFSSENLAEQGTVYSEPFVTQGERTIYAIAIVNGASSDCSHKFLYAVDDH